MTLRPFGSLLGALGLPLESLCLPLAVLWGPFGSFGLPWAALGCLGLPWGAFWARPGPDLEKDYIVFGEGQNTQGLDEPSSGNLPSLSFYLSYSSPGKLPYRYVEICVIRYCTR